MKSTTLPLTDQHFLLRLLIMFIALVGHVNSSLRQVLLQILLFLLFFLLDLPSFARLIRAFRILLMFLAAYWLFATLLGTPFPTMSLFSLKLVFFAQVSVYTFSHLSTPRVVHDLRYLLRKPQGRNLILYFAATVMFIQSLRRHLDELKSSHEKWPERLYQASKASLAEGPEISSRLETALENPDFCKCAKPASLLIGLVLLTLMVLLGAF